MRLLDLARSIHLQQLRCAVLVATMSMRVQPTTGMVTRAAHSFPIRMCADHAPPSGQTQAGHGDKHLCSHDTEYDPRHRCKGTSLQGEVPLCTDGSPACCCDVDGSCTDGSDDWCCPNSAPFQGKQGTCVRRRLVHSCNIAPVHSPAVVLLQRHTQMYVYRTYSGHTGHSMPLRRTWSKHHVMIPVECGWYSESK